MKKSEALKILSLNSDASETDINKQFRKLSLQYHPDHGGDTENMNKLLLARDTLLEKGNALVSLDTATELIRTSILSINKVQERKNAVDQQIKHIQRVTTSPTRNFRRNAGMFSGISAGLALLSTQVIPLIENYFTNSIETVSLAFSLLAAFGGLLFWVYDQRLKSIEISLENLNDIISDKEKLFGILTNLLGSHAHDSKWSRDDLIHRISPESITIRYEQDDKNHFDHITFHRVLRRVGPYELARLLIKKGLELDLLDEDVDTKVGKFSYQLK